MTPIEPAKDYLIKRYDELIEFHRARGKNSDQPMWQNNVDYLEERKKALTNNQTQKGVKSEEGSD